MSANGLADLSTIYLFYDPFTQAAASSCFYDWGGNSRHGYISDAGLDVWTPRDNNAAPPVLGSSALSGDADAVTAVYYEYDGTDTYVPVNFFHSLSGELAAFTFAAWVWTDYYSLSDVRLQAFFITTN